MSVLRTQWHEQACAPRPADRYVNIGPGHWHHTCWQCGQEHCGFAREYYQCDCGCEEHRDSPAFSNNPDFDREFAATHASPA